MSMHIVLSFWGGDLGRRFMYVNNSQLSESPFPKPQL